MSNITKNTQIHQTNVIDSSGTAISVATCQWQEGAQFFTQIIPMRGAARESYKAMSHLTEEAASKSLDKRLSAAIKYYQKAATNGVYLTPSELKKTQAQAQA